MSQALGSPGNARTPAAGGLCSGWGGLFRGPGRLVILFPAFHTAEPQAQRSTHAGKAPDTGGAEGILTPPYDPSPAETRTGHSQHQRLRFTRAAGRAQERWVSGGKCAPSVLGARSMPTAPLPVVTLVAGEAVVLGACLGLVLLPEAQNAGRGGSFLPGPSRPARGGEGEVRPLVGTHAGPATPVPPAGRPQAPFPP